VHRYLCRPPVGLALLCGGLALGACQPATVIATPAATPEPSGRTESSPASTAPQAQGSALPQLMVTNEGVKLDGVLLAPPATALTRLDPLNSAVRPRARAEQPKPGESSYQLAIEPGADVPTLKSAFQTAAMAGWTSALVLTPAGRVVVSALVPRPPGAHDASLNIAANASVVLSAHATVTELWMLQSELDRDATSESQSGGLRAGSPKTRQTPPQPAGVWDTSATTTTGRQQYLRRCDKQTPCRAVALQVTDDLPTSALVELLTLVAEGCTRAGQGPCEVGLRVNPPQAPGVPPVLRSKTMRVGDTTVYGRLAPAVIQSAVRESYGKLRACYEAGLGRRPELKGRIVVRFVIGRDGKVGAAVLVPPEAEGDKPATSGGTTLAEPEAERCMLEVFRALQFPEPEGGIVTVVYPIQFEPK
jgi:hypothetical protein